MGTPIHHLEILARCCRADVRLNGFPLGVVVAAGEHLAGFSPPVNPYLAGKRNLLEAEISTAEGPDGAVPFERAELQLVVRRFEKGDIVEPGAGDVVSRYVLEGERKKEIEDGRAQAPVRISHRFETKGADLSADLLDARPHADVEALRDYAMKLRGLMAARDDGGLLVEHEPKVRAWAAAYEEPYDRLAASMGNGLRAFFGDGPDLAFAREDVELRPWCGSRIWELRRKGDLPLLRSGPLADGGRTHLDVFVAPRNGTLRIVR
jgi:hypothetical protein